MYAIERHCHFIKLPIPDGKHTFPTDVLTPQLESEPKLIETNSLLVQFSSFTCNHFHIMSISESLRSIEG